MSDLTGCVFIGDAKIQLVWLFSKWSNEAAFFNCLTLFRKSSGEMDDIMSNVYFYQLLAKIVTKIVTKLFYISKFLRRL